MGHLLPQTKLAELAEQLQESQAKLAEAQDSLAMERDGVAALRSECESLKSHLAELQVSRLSQAWAYHILQGKISGHSSPTLIMRPQMWPTLLSCSRKGIPFPLSTP